MASFHEIGFPYQIGSEEESCGPEEINRITIFWTCQQTMKMMHASCLFSLGGGGFVVFHTYLHTK